ncbi:Hypothetical predicted protein [Octopus vulgaris]|uniref:Uncharacterized protein n=1 Tax=Octopus vulgaris TaxID=6645 RepID=A0AA36BDC3_OCTVU|nr:Hypothetical predicted protein [Octopus vulgaris]
MFALCKVPFGTGNQLKPDLLSLYRFPVYRKSVISPYLTRTLLICIHSFSRLPHDTKLFEISSSGKAFTVIFSFDVETCNEVPKKQAFI